MTEPTWADLAQAVKEQYEAYIAAGFSESVAADFCAASLSRPFPVEPAPELNELMARMSRFFEEEIDR